MGPTEKKPSFAAIRKLKRKMAFSRNTFSMMFLATICMSACLLCTTDALPSIADVCEEYFHQTCDCGDSSAAALFHKRAPGWGKRAGNDAEETPAEIFGRLAQMKRAPGWGKRGEK